MTIAYLNGEFLPLNDVKISPMDRGFLFGDGIYEIIPVFAKKPFRLEEHLLRLHHSLEAIELNEHVNIDMRFIINELIEKNSPVPEQAVYLQITRGPNDVREHLYPKVVKPTVFAYCQPINRQDINILSQGIKVITAQDLRWQRCDIKSIGLLANILQRNQAIKAQASETLLLDGEEVLEGTASNVFIVKNNLLLTPPLSHKILGGITRDLILEIAVEKHVPCKEQPIKLVELYQADEVWITSSTKEVLPVLKVDEHPIAHAKPGKLWHQMIRYFQDYKNGLISKN